MKRTELKRRTPLKASKWGVSDKPPKPIRKVNPERKATRQREYRKHLASAEYKHARKEAMWRAQDRCEYREPTKDVSKVFTMPRCTETNDLEAHHLRYPKSRPLEARDLLILCTKHHAWIEMTQHSHRHTR
jgi:hypothetical protein